MHACMQMQMHARMHACMHAAAACMHACMHCMHCVHCIALPCLVLSCLALLCVVNYNTFCHGATEDPKGRLGNPKDARKGAKGRHGTPWAPLGFPWVPMGSPWGPMGSPWVPIGSPWGPHNAENAPTQPHITSTSSPKRPQNGKEGTLNQSSTFWVGKGAPSPRPREAGETSKASKSLIGGRVASERPRDTKRTRRVPKGWRKGSQEGAASEKGCQEGAKKEARDHDGSAVDSNEALLVPLPPLWHPPGSLFSLGAASWVPFRYPFC